MKKNALFLMILGTLSGCATNPNAPINQNDFDSFLRMQNKLEEEAKTDVSFGKKPGNILNVAKKYYSKDLIVMVNPKAYKSEKTTINGYVSCFKDKDGNIEMFFTHDDVVINSSKETPLIRLREKSDCNKYLKYENVLSARNINAPTTVSVIDELNRNTLVEGGLGKVQKPDINEFNPEATPVSNIYINKKSEPIISLINKFQDIEKTPKDEFMKSSEYENKINALKLKEYRFITDKSKILGSDTFAIKYDADNEILNVNINVKTNSFMLSQRDLADKKESIHNKFGLKIPYVQLEHKSTRRKYVGQNAFGVKANVSSTLLEEFGLAFNNIKQEYEQPIFSFSLPISPNEARKIKDDLEFYIDVEPANSQIFKTNLLYSVGGHKATISNPSEFYVSSRFVLFNLKEIGLFNKNTGEVLAIKKYK